MSIDLFNTFRVRRALAEQNVTERQSFEYAVASGVLGLVYGYWSGYVGWKVDWFSAYEILVAVGILFVGLKECFRANGGDAGADFLKRLYVLNVPLGLKIFALNVIVFFASWYLFPLVITRDVFRDPSLVWQIYSFVWTNGLTVVYFWRMHAHLGAVRRMS